MERLEKKDRDSLSTTKVVSEKGLSISEFRWKAFAILYAVGILNEIRWA